MLGEELGDRRQLLGADLHAAFVDLVLPVGLPELVRRPQRIVRRKDDGGEGIQLAFQRLPRFRRETHLECGIAGSEDAREHPLGIRRGELPGIDAALGGQFAALVHRDGLPQSGLHEQMILGQEPREEHPVPVLVRNLVREPVERLCIVGGTRVTELLAVRAKARTKGPRPRVLVHRVVRTRAIHGQRFERLPRARLGPPARVSDRAGEVVAKIGSDRRHGGYVSRSRRHA